MTISFKIFNIRLAKYLILLILLIDTITLAKVGVFNTNTVQENSKEKLLAEVDWIRIKI